MTNNNMCKILFFDKGGRIERIKLVENNNAPKDFFQGIDFLRSMGFNIEHISSNKKYKKNILFTFGKIIEEIFSRLTNIGIRPLSVHQFKKYIDSSKYVISLTDGFSLSLGFYYSFIDKRNKIKLAGGFHKLSDYDRKLPKLLQKIYYKIFLKILQRLDYLIFYGPADRLNSIKHFNLDKSKTFIIKFGVDIDFWKRSINNTFFSKYIFSIGQDPSRDFETLLKVNSNKKIHIHTSLLSAQDSKKFKITNGSYQKHNVTFSDSEIRTLYQESFAVIVPLKDVFQPSGYSVTLQAMACGKPVIITKTKGLWAPKIFKNKENCIFVKPGSSLEIENAIKYLDLSQSKYEEISENARKTAVKYFSLTQANNSTLEILEKIT